MAGTIYSGTYFSGIVLSNPATQIPATIAAGAYVTNTTTLHNGDAVYGSLGTAWTVANLGTITGPRGDGIQLESGGYVSNAGSITASYTGLEIDAAAGTVVNSGTIAGTGTAGIGVDLTASGSTLTNAGTITGAGGTAVAFYGAGNRLILDPGATFNGAAVASGAVNNTLELAAGTGTVNGAFSNFGTLQEDAGGAWTVPGNFTFFDGTIAAGASLTEAGPLTFTSSLGNSGTIAAAITLTSGAYLDNQATGLITNAGPAVSATGPATVVNSGVIDGDPGISLQAGGSVTNTGTISGSLGIEAGQGPATVTNLGTISATSYGSGILLGAGGDVVNGSTTAPGALITAYGSALNLSGIPGTVTNYGTILNRGVDIGAGISLRTGGTLTNHSGALIESRTTAIRIGGSGTIVNFGTIADTSTYAYRPAVSLGYPSGTLPGGNSTLTNAGTITGAGGTAVVFYGTGNRLILDPGAAFSGIVNGGTANDTLELASGTGTGTLSGFGTSFVGFGTLTVDPGASWQLTAANTIAAGYIVTDAGTLANAGGIFSPVTLNAGGYLDNQASGLISSTGDAVLGGGGPGTVVNAGTIAGTSGGIKLASGGSVVNAGSITASGNAVEIDNGGTVANSGLILAANGDGVFLNAGGTVGNTATIIGNDGIFVTAGSGFVTNSAEITGSSDGVYLGAGGTVSNQGTIAGVGPSGRGVDFAASGSTLTNAGTITGAGGTAVAFYGDGNRLILDPGAVFNGVARASGILDNTLELAAGANVGTITSSFYNFDILQEDASASWVVSGSFTFSDGTIAPGASLTETGPLTFTGSLANSGTIAASVTLTAGASLTNQATGTISSAGAYAVLGSGGPTTVSNLGAVAGTGLSSDGIKLANGGAVVNAGSITAGLNAVEIDNGGTVANSGLILAANGDGVFLNAGGTVGNTATIIGNDGIFVTAGSGFVTNSAEIAGSSDGVYLGAGGYLGNQATGLISGAGAYAVLGRGGPTTVSNLGAVAGTGLSSDGIKLASGGSVVNAGSITASGNAVEIDSGGTIANSGLIDAANGQGVFLNAGGTVGNTATIIGNDGIFVTAGSGFVANSAEITGSSDGVYLGAGGIVSNLGTIAGTGPSGIGVDFAYSGSTLTNAGTIIGAGGTAVAFAGGGNRVIADPGAVFSGVVDGGTGSDTLELAAGGGTGTLSGLGTSFTGFTTVAVDPGAVWQVSDASTAPPGFTNDGTIVVGAAGLVFGAVSEDSGSSGVIDVGGSGVAEFASTVAAGQTLVFTAPGNARLDQPGGFAGAVAGFLPGDTLDLAGIVANAASYSSGVLTLTDSGAPVARLNLSTPLGSRASFRLYPDGAGGTNLTVAARPGNIFPGFYPNGIVLDNPAVESPPTITATAYVTNTPGHDSVHATAGFAWTVTNYGRIAGPGNGISLAAPGVVLTSGNITGANGIDLAAGGTIANSGTVAGSANAGVYMGNGGYVLNGASAAAGALLTGRYGVEIGGSAGSALLAVNLATIYGINLGFTAAGDPIGNTLVNAGTIGGGAGTAIQFGGGNDLLVIDPHAVFLGQVNGGAGTNAIELAAGSGTGALLGLGSKFVNLPSIYVDPGAVWRMAGVPATPPEFSNDGRIIVGNGHRLLLGAVGEDPGMSGVIAVRTRGTLEFAGGVDPQQTVRFADNTGTVILNDPQDFGATIQGFQAGDTIDVKTVAADGFTYANGALTLTSGGNPTATLAISGNLGASQFALAPDGQGGTDVTVAAGQLFSFTFVYADGEAYYSGTVADNGSLGYAAIVNSSNPTIGEPNGTYYLANDGPATTQPSGAVTVESYAVSPPNANAAQTFVPLATSQGQFDGHAGLGSEADQISVNGTLFGFSPSLEFHPLLAS